ncbi:hypothetical protein [uncultured Kordia sp.]|uniref:hypothetical protein n=1 Tax=uncultured Kordia sp. TaxID=507699 RepID=UPI00261D77DA|nr:hypothetical protein [uncultured Kordia sp.]
MMKKIVYILCFLFCVACNQHAPKSENATMKSQEFTVDKDGLLDDTDYKTDLKKPDLDFSLIGYLDTEISAKLQANYEAKILATKHPEFQEAIKEQLAGSDKFNVSLSDSIETIEIKDVERFGIMRNRNDSITTQKIRYTSLINSKYTQKDSVLVVIKRAMIVIDNEFKINTSFSFEKLD